MRSPLTKLMAFVALALLVLACSSTDNGAEDPPDDVPDIDGSTEAAAGSGEPETTDETTAEPADATAEPVELQVLVNAADFNETIPGFYEEVARRFGEKFPGVTVSFDVVPNDQLSEQVRTEGIGGGGFHDAAVVFNVPELAAEGVLEDLSNGIGDWASFANYGDGQKARVTYQGGVYGVTNTNNTNGVWYNSDLLAEAGVDPDALATMDGFIAGLEAVRDAELTTADGDEVFPLSINASRSDWFTSNFIYGAGGTLINADGSVGVDTPELLEGFELLRQLFDDELAPRPDGDYGINRGLFEQGRAAFWIAGEWDGPPIVEALGDSAGFVAQPRWKAGATPLGGADWVVPLGSQNRDLAVEWLKFLVSQEVQQYAFDEFARLPVDIDGPIEGGITDPVLDIIATSVSNDGRLLDTHLLPDKPEVVDLWLGLIDEVVYGETAVAELLADYDGQIQEAFGG